MTALAELRRLLAKATPGPWTAAVDGYDETYVAGNRELRQGQGHRFASVAEAPALNRAVRDTWKRDAALIVALRNHADALLDVAEAALAYRTARGTYVYNEGIGTKGRRLREHELAAEQAYERLLEVTDALARLDAKETP